MTSATSLALPRFRFPVSMLAPLLMLPLAGCLSFASKPPPSLMTLAPAEAPAAGETQRTGDTPTITIAIQSEPAELATPRVPVRSGGTEVAYVKGAHWVEPPSRRFVRLLGAKLTGELRAFGIDADRREAVVTFDAALQRGPDPALEKRRFEARVPVAKIEAAPVGVALNQAANQVAASVADWVGSGR